MKGLIGLAVVVGGFFLLKNLRGGVVSDDAAARQILALMKEEEEAYKASNPSRALEIKVQIDTLKEAHPNAPLYKYV